MPRKKPPVQAGDDPTAMPVTPKLPPESIRRFGESDFQRLIAAYSVCHHMGDAIRTTGFSSGTVYMWLKNHPDKLSEFKKGVEAPMFARIGELGNEQRDWRAFAWCLERTQPEKYALTSTTRIEHSGSVEHNVKLIPESELHRMALMAREIEVEVIK